MFLKIIKWGLIICLIMTTATAMLEETTLDYIKTNDTLVMTNEYNTIIITSQSGTIKVKTDCQSTYNQTITSFQEIQIKYDELYNDMKNGTIKCKANADNTAILDELDTFRLMLNDATNEIVQCAGITQDFTKCQLKLQNTSLIETVNNKEISYCEQRLNDLESSNKWRSFLIAILIIGLLAVTVFFLKGSDYNQKKLM